MENSKPIALDELPVGHPLRTASLISIGAQFRWVGNMAWRSVGKTWRIAQCCFDDLGPAWTAHSHWRTRCQ